MNAAMKKQRWRLLLHTQSCGALNMAVDEAILQAHMSGQTPPTVRLYLFDPPTITIGYAQKFSRKDVERIRQKGIEVVRRPTGGRAVLHANDLTYSFIGTSADSNNSTETKTLDYYRWHPFLSPSVSGAYKEICQGLLNAMELLKVDAALGESDAPYRNVHDCFLATTMADLQANGRKLVGSAQLRRGNGVLQHGSILLNQDQQLMESLLTGKDPISRSEPRHANLYEIAGRIVPIEELEARIKSGFEKAFQCDLVVGSLSAFELELAQALKSKYESAAFLHDGSSHDCASAMSSVS